MKIILINTAVLLVCSLLVKCKKYQDKEYNEDLVFSLKAIDTAGVRNDGRTVIGLVFEKTIEVKAGMKVTFESTKGTFLANDIPVTANETKTQLKVDQDTGIFYIKAILKDAANKIRAERRINFALRPAFPDLISLEPDRLSFNFTNNKVMTMQTYLLRNVALVTKGNSASFRAYQLGLLPTDTIDVGRFTGTINNVSGADGKLQNPVLFYSDVPGIDPLKPVYVKVFAKNDLRQEVWKVIQLTYVP